MKIPILDTHSLTNLEVILIVAFAVMISIRFFGKRK